MLCRLNDPKSFQSVSSDCSNRSHVGSGVGYDSLNRTIRSFSGFHGPWIPCSCLQITTISLGLKSKGFRNVNLWLKNYVAKRKEFVEWSIKNSIQIRGEYPHLVGSLRSLRSTLLFLTIVSRSTIPFTGPKLNRQTNLGQKRRKGSKKFRDLIQSRDKQRRNIPGWSKKQHVTRGSFAGVDVKRLA